MRGTTYSQTDYINAWKDTRLQTTPACAFQTVWCSVQFLGGEKHLSVPKQKLTQLLFGTVWRLVAGVCDNHLYFDFKSQIQAL